MTRRLPPIESLRVLDACVRHASFTCAATEIGVTPAAISLRIRNLESELGTVLFHRSGPRLKPTRAAEVLAIRLGEALRTMQTAVADCRGSAQALRLTAVPSFAARWLAPRLMRYHQRPDSIPIQLDSSIELRAPPDFDMAIRTGRGNWPNFELTRLMPVDATPLLHPALATSVRLSSPVDLARLPLLPHDDWPLWFRHAGVRVPRLRFCADEYPTHDLDCVAAMAGAGVALLSPTLFASSIREGKLIQPFTHVMRGRNWHFLLLKPDETRSAVRNFRAWLQEEIADRNSACIPPSGKRHVFDQAGATAP